MLSDGAGAVVVEGQPRLDGISLRIDWSNLVSHAHRFPVCMYAGAATSEAIEPGATWQDPLQWVSVASPPEIGSKTVSS